MKTLAWVMMLALVCSVIYSVIIHNALPAAIALVVITALIVIYLVVGFWGLTFRG